MGKSDGNYRLPVTQPQSDSGAGGNFFCQRCCTTVNSHFSLKCAVVVIFTLAAFLSAIFFVVPFHHRQAGFDAKQSVKHTASVQAYFKLQKPVSELVHYIARLEYDVNLEVGIPASKVVVLSLHASKLPNSTDVVFGYLPDQDTSTVNMMYLSVLKSSLIDVFLKVSNLTLTSSIFGEAYSFEILKVPGGITIIPEPDAFTLQIPQSLFNFTLNSTIYDVKENLQQLKEQLKLGLHLMPNEVLYMQLTNKRGSTKDPPVTIEAYVASNSGMLLPERLRELAQTITDLSPTDNLGLDHSVFGKVKEISLSSFLKHSLDPPPPTPSPCPAPSPSEAPSYSPAFAPSSYHSPSPMSNSPAASPSIAHDAPNCGSVIPPSPSPTSHSGGSFPIASPQSSPRPTREGFSPEIPSSSSPLPGMHSQSPDRKGGKNLVSSSSGSSCTWRSQWSTYLIGMLVFLLQYLIS